MPDDRPTFLSLFSGIGGLDLAIEALGFRCVGQVEIDPWCRSQLERHWPAVPRWADVTEFTRAEMLRRFESGASRLGGSTPPRPTVPDAIGIRRNGGPPDAGRCPVEGTAAPRSGSLVDLICGGFPCQPVSHAGKRKAQKDARWLWPEFARCIRELRPRWVVVENVPGLLSAGEPSGSALTEVVWDLASMGFVSRWGCVRASDIGAPHRRERFFLVAERADTDSEARGPARGAGEEVHRPGAVERPGRLGGHPAPTPTSNDTKNAGYMTSNGRQYPTLPGAVGGTDHYASRMEAADDRSEHPDLGPEPSTLKALTNWGPYEPAIRRWEAIHGEAPPPLEDGRLSAAFVEWMMGFAPGWTEGKRNQRLKALGNAVMAPQAALALSLLLHEPTAP